MTVGHGTGIPGFLPQNMSSRMDDESGRPTYPGESGALGAISSEDHLRNKAGTLMHIFNCIEQGSTSAEMISTRIWKCNGCEYL